MSLVKGSHGGLGGSGAPGGPLGSFYTHTLDQSLKFNDADSPYLHRTPASQGNLTTFTFSFWFKRSVLGSYQEIFHEYPGSGERSQILFMNNDTLKVELEAGNTNQFLTNMVFRDTSAWYNIVVVFNSGDSTSTNRVKIYVNGVDQADTANGGGGFSTANYPSQGATSGFNRTNQHEISTYDGSDYHLDGYLAEVNFIDGTALTAASFGETKNGIWIPKDTSGLTFGTNGFHLTFKDDVISEGFNTVTFTGTGAAQSISGLGFSPALVWLKERTDADAHLWFDVVRGSNKKIYSNLTNAEYTVSDEMISFDADGFSLGTSGNVTTDGNKMVAWCWEAGGTPTADNSAGVGATPTAGSVKIDGSNLGSALAGTIAATRISADTSKGFSIVTYTGNYTAGATVAHGLGAAPKWILIKKRGGADDWFVYHDALGATKGINLNTTAAAFTGTVYNNTAPTSSVFSLGQSNGVNENSQTFVAYCWAEVSGYSKFGSYTGNGSTTGPSVTLGFAPAFVMIKAANTAHHWVIYDNTRNPDNRGIDLAIRPNTSEAELSSGSLDFIEFTSTGFQIKNNDNTHNTNGNTYIYMAFADTRESAFFKDVSSNGNHFTPVNLDYRDSVPDTPTNNFATFNPLDTYAGATTFSEGNLKGVTTSGGTGRQTSTIRPASGKWYAEFYVADSTRFAVGIENGQRTNSAQGGNDVNSIIASYNGQYYYNGGGGSYMSSLSNGNIVQVAMDVDNKLVFIGINNTWQNSATASEIEAGTATNSLGAKASATAATLFQGDMGIFTEDNSGSGAMSSIANFGQDSSFAGNYATANSNADENGFGSFAYAPPTGFLALCSQNLPDVDIIDGTENFNTVLYTGTGSSRSVTGVGFSPDWIWMKSRSDASGHRFYDVVRGAGKGLSSHSTGEEYIETGLTSFDSDGFSLGTQAGTNGSGTSMVAWNWLAGGSAVTNNNGSITSSVSANTKAGFSIVSFDLQSSGSKTVGHGLSAAPELYFLKGTTSSGAHWFTYYGDATDYMTLNSSGAGADDDRLWDDTSPTSTVFTVGSLFTSGSYGAAHIAYCFHSVEGYSKIGNYVGNGSADGTFVYTGFRPAWVMVKRSSAAGGWHMFDNKRPNAYNVIDKRLEADNSDAENSTSGCLIDLVSNGFKFRGTFDNINGSGATHIYLAFAEAPFKYANAR